MIDIILLIIIAVSLTTAIYNIKKNKGGCSCCKNCTLNCKGKDENEL